MDWACTHAHTHTHTHVIYLVMFYKEHSEEKEMATHSSILAWRIHGQRSLVGYSPQGRKESDTISLSLLSLFNYYSWWALLLVLYRLLRFSSFEQQTFIISSILWLGNLSVGNLGGCFQKRSLSFQNLTGEEVARVCFPCHLQEALVILFIWICQVLDAALGILVHVEYFIAVLGLSGCGTRA